MLCFFIISQNLLYKFKFTVLRPLTVLFIWKVAKVSKLLLLMEKGESNKYRGKSLNEININVIELVSEEEEHISDVEQEELINSREGEDNAIVINPTIDELQITSNNKVWWH